MSEHRVSTGRRPAERRSKWKWRVGLLLLYILSYLALSSQGRYVSANRGGQDWRSEWCPPLLVRVYRAPTGRQRTTLTPLGVLFLPCLLLDSLLWHRGQSDRGGPTPSARG